MSQKKPQNLNEALVQLAATVAGSIGYIEEQIAGITEGIVENNPHRIETVAKYTANVTKLSNEAIQRTLQAFVVFKPKANDAKLILISWRIATSLERISALLYDISLKSKTLDLDKISGAKATFLNLHNALMSQTYNMVIAYTADRADVIDEIVRKEQHIRNVYKSFFRETLIMLIENPHLTSHGETCLDIAKIFEMIAYYMHEISTHLSYKFALKPQ